MDESASKSKPSAPGISIRNGPIDDDSMDIDQPNGTAKRKSRSSISNNVSYKDNSDSDDEIPLVGTRTLGCCKASNSDARLWTDTGARPNDPKRLPRIATTAMMSP